MNLRHSDGTLADTTMPVLPLAGRDVAVAVQRSPGKKAETKDMQGNQDVGVEEKTSLRMA